VILGLAVIFALSPASAYYWIMLLMLPLRQSQGAAIAVFAVSVAIQGLAWIYTGLEYEPWLYAILAWSYLSILAGWILPEAAKALPAGRP